MEWEGNLDFVASFKGFVFIYFHFNAKVDLFPAFSIENFVNFRGLYVDVE